MRQLAVLLSGGLILLSAATAAAPGVSRNGRPPQVNYMTECQGCHLPDGSGMTGKVPSLKGEVHRFLEVKGGRAFLIQVPGSANSKLSDADLADLINWMIIRFGPAPSGGFAPYTAAEVASLRRERLVDVTGTRASLVAAFDTPH